MFGNRTVTLPFSDYCDPLVADLDSWRSLTETLLASGDPMVVRCLHCDVPLADSRLGIQACQVARARPRTWSRRLWGGLDSAPQRAIRHSQRNGVTVRWASDPRDLRTFFDMHLAVRKYKYGMLAQPFAFFENIWRHFVQRGEGYLLLATHDERVLGGVMLLRWKDTLYYKFNASASADLAHRPNDSWRGNRSSTARPWGARSSISGCRTGIRRGCSDSSGSSARRRRRFRFFGTR